MSPRPLSRRAALPAAGPPAPGLLAAGPLTVGLLAVALLGPGCAGSRATEAGLVGRTDLVLAQTLAAVRDDAGACRFNQDRPYAVGLNRVFEDTTLPRSLAAALEAADHDDAVVIHWFGDEPPDRIELVLGRDLPAPLAAAIVSAAASASPLPVALSQLEEDTELCPRSQAYVGSVLPTPTLAWNPAQLAELAALGDDPAAFWARVPASGR